MDDLHRLAKKEASRDHTHWGDVEEARSYLDSILLADHARENKYNALVILRAEQELFETETNLRKQQLFHQQIIVQLTVAALVLLAATLLFILYLYRKKRSAYHQLVLRTQEWANRIEVIPAAKPNEAEPDGLALTEAINKLVEEEKIYTNPELTTESLYVRQSVCCPIRLMMS